MSLVKLLKMPARLFKKDVITFLVICRYDLGILEDKLRYIAVKPTASIFTLRQKIWHLLELPDYCEEVIILKYSDKEIPLTALRKGNDPHHPYVLEVWLPGKLMLSSTTIQVLPIKGHESLANGDAGSKISAFKKNIEAEDTAEFIAPMLSRDLPSADGLSNFIPDYKTSNLSCKVSNSSLFYKLHGRKSRDNFAKILIKIQSDLSTLSYKLSNLESKIRL